jgi:hypothetical protein
MKMLGMAYAEAEVAYRRDRLMNDMHRASRGHRPARVRWVQGLIDAIKTSNSPVRGASRYELDGPIVQPKGAPHHAASH